MRIHLDAGQGAALADMAWLSGRKPTDLVSDAVDAYLLGLNASASRHLDAATRRANADIERMLKMLDRNARQHPSFMAKIARLQVTTFAEQHSLTH